MFAGEQDDDWLNAEMSIETDDTDSDLVIEALVGHSYQGDIAIDDLVVTLGDCTGQTAKDVLCPCDGSTSSPGPPHDDSPVCNCPNAEFQALISNPGIHAEVQNSTVQLTPLSFSQKPFFLPPLVLCVVVTSCACVCVCDRVAGRLRGRL